MKDRRKEFEEDKKKMYRDIDRMLVADRQFEHIETLWIMFEERKAREFDAMTMKKKIKFVKDYGREEYHDGECRVSVEDLIEDCEDREADSPEERRQQLIEIVCDVSKPEVNNDFVDFCVEVYIRD